MTYYRDFLRPTRAGVPDRSYQRSNEFAVKRRSLGHSVRRFVHDKGYRVVFSPGVIHLAQAVEAVKE